VPRREEADDRHGAAPTPGPKKPRELLGDGNFGGLYKRPDEEMLALWKVAVEETRDVDVDVDVIEGPWA
jgi:creatinine amidohydrolase